MGFGGVKFSDIMPVVVVLGPKGLWSWNLRTGEDCFLAHFPEDFKAFVDAFTQTYAKGAPRWWVKTRLLQLLEFLDIRDGYIFEGDLVRVEDGRLWGVMTLSDLAKELKRIYGPDMEDFLMLIVEMLMETRQELEETELPPLVDYPHLLSGLSQYSKKQDPSEKEN